MLAHKAGVIADGVAVAGSMRNGAIGAMKSMVLAFARLEVASMVTTVHAWVQAITDLAAVQQALVQVPALGMKLNVLGVPAQNPIARLVRLASVVSA